MEISNVAGQHPESEFDNNTKSKRNGLIGALVYTILILVLTFIQIFKKMDPIPEPQGLMASFEEVEIMEEGGGSSSGEEVKADPQPSTPKSKSVETNDDMKSDVKSNNSKTKEDDNGLNFGEFKGSNTTGGGGDKKTGTLGPVSGPGKGEGDGDLEGNGGRKCRTNCTSCSVKSDWDEVGDAYVAISIDASGKVIDAKMADAKKYPKNANFFGKQVTIALECAKQRKYESGSETNKQVVKISFRKG
jgi:hypothetical protein